MEFLIVFIIGTLTGSFLNVCIYRIPRGKSLLFPGSFCPVCEKPIAWHDKVPILSFLFLRGRCRSCGEHIPVKYFLVELLTAGLTVLLYRFFGFSPGALVYFVMVCLLITAAFIDMERREIPDVISLPGILAGMVLVTAFRLEGSYLLSFISSALGVLAGGGSMFLLGYVGELIFKKDALGGGDIKLMAMIGAFLGWQLVLLTFFLAPVLGLGFGVFAMIKKKREAIAYGPYLASGALVSLFFGEKMLRYLFLY